MKSFKACVPRFNLSPRKGNRSSSILRCCSGKSLPDHGADSARFAGTQALTRTDLLATVALLSLLWVIQWSALGHATSDPKQTICRNNLRQLTLAWTLFAEDHDGGFPGNADGGGVQDLSNSNRTWVLGWLDLNGGSGQPTGANTNTDFLTQYSQLAPYTGGVADIFKCPEDRSVSPPSGKPRVRSVSMNSWVGGIDSQGLQVGRAFNSAFTVTRSFDQMIDPPPSHKNVFIDERDDSINDGTFFVAMSGWPNQPENYHIVDYPAEWHNRGANLSFADNHVEYWRWENPRTMPPHEPGQEIPLVVESPDNPDVRRLQEVSSRPIPRN